MYLDQKNGEKIYSNCNIVDGEIHVIYQCGKYSILQDQLYRGVINKITL